MIAKFHALSKRRQGEFFQFAGLLLWAFFPIVTVWVNASIDPIWQAALATLFAVPVFAILLTVKNCWSELQNRAAWLPMIISSLLIGVIFFGLTFTAYRYTTAGNGSIISLSEVLYSFVFFGLIMRHERYTFSAFLGTILMLIGAGLVLFQGSFQPQLGDLILLGALFLTPIGNYFQQQARQHVSSGTIMFFRSALSGICLSIIAFYFNGMPAVNDFSGETLILIAVSGLFFMGISKMLWLEAIHRIPVAHANSISAFTPGLTLALAFFILGEVPTWWQVAGFLPMLAGAWIILNKDFLHTKLAEVSE